MSNIRTYEVGTAEFNRLFAVAKLIESYTGCPTYAQDVYFDLGQDWMWTTIVTQRPGKARDSYQMLYPAQHEKIISGDLEEVFKVTKDLVENHLFIK